MDKTFNISIIKEFSELKSMIIEIRDEVKKLTAESDKDFLTPAEVCAMLNISRSTYQRYVNKGIIEQIKLNPEKNNKVHVRRSLIESLIEKGKL